MKSSTLLKNLFKKLFTISIEMKRTSNLSFIVKNFDQKIQIETDKIN